MPNLRSSKSKKLEQIDNFKGDAHTVGTTLSTHTLSKKFQQLVSSISITDIKKSLRSSPSEAKFYSSICEEELKKLLTKRDDLEEKIRTQEDHSTKKNAEASKIISKLLEEMNKRIREVKHKSKLPKTVGVKPTDVKRIFNDAKKLSESFRMRKNKLLIQRQKLKKRIRQAQNTIQFCNKFINQKKI